MCSEHYLAHTCIEKIQIESNAICKKQIKTGKQNRTQTTDTQWRHRSKKSENLGRCGKQNMLRQYLKFGSGMGFSAVQWRRFPHRASVVRGSIYQSKMEVLQSLTAFFCLGFSSERKIWGNERIYFPENPDLCLISVGTPPNLHV